MARVIDARLSMLLHALALLPVCLGMAWSRDNGKAFKSLPTISNSIVNLGKMDIAFHFNSKVPEYSARDGKAELAGASFFSKPDSVVFEEPCPCSSLNNLKNPTLNHPSEILDKLLMHNDLFSNNLEPVSSAMCCGSHEHVQEDTVFLEFGPKQLPLDGQPQANNLPANVPMLPFILGNMIPKSAPQLKPKAIEIFFFPKKREMVELDVPKKQQMKKDFIKKNEIKVVGDKEMRNDFKSFNFKPSVPITSLFKKDLNQLEKNEKIESEKQETPKHDKVTTTTTIMTNAL